jgi:hypothetical protein
MKYRIASCLFVCSILLFNSCAPSKYFIGIHNQETAQNHYVVVDQTYGTMYDCYSKPDSVTWCPTCREIDIQGKSDWQKENQDDQHGSKKLR